MLSIIICDDDQTINHQLLPIIQQYLEQKKIPAAIQQYTDAKKLLEDMPLFDIMFLDVEMPEQNGIEVAKAFRQQSNWGQIIYLTNYAQYAQTAYSVHPFGYLTKPIDEESINKILEEALEYLEEVTPPSVWCDDRHRDKTCCCGRYLLF